MANFLTFNAFATITFGGLNTSEVEIFNEFNALKCAQYFKNIIKV